MESMRIILVYLISIITVNAFGQGSPTYSLRGTMLDDVSKQPIIGALVYVRNFENEGTVTDEEGEFKLVGLPLGRHTLQTSYIGYIATVMDIEIKSGKELVIDVLMKEDVSALNEVVVTAKDHKSRAINTMSYASSRTFSVEESNKFAGAVDDPARMAQSFAGVMPANDGNNYISIRGNHPSSLLYRVEGIDVPNPNHFGDIASSGGGVSVLSSQVLSDSDFSTGAFSSEYGNAIGGIFDIRLRKGNNEKREYTFKAGFLGIEAAVEGPFSKKYKGSYLVNYRYSTLSLISKLGVDLTGVLNYTDLSYNIHLPLKKGRVSLFGINGKSNQDIDQDIEDLPKDSGATSHSSLGKFISDVYINGGKYSVPIFGGKGFLTATIAHSITDGGLREETKTEYTHYAFFNKFDIRQKNDKISSALTMTKKVNAKLSFRTGAYFDRLGYSIQFDDYQDATNFTSIVDNKDNTSLGRAYGQLQYRWNEKWSANVGLHYAHFFLNGSQSVEPRGNIQYDFSKKTNLSIAYGRHSQIQPLVVYFVKDANGNLINKSLDFTKANHLVLTYNHNINEHTRIKTELYYQSLSKVPIGLGPNANYAIVNQQFLFPDFKLVNDGKGRNMGMELTVERFMKNNFYYIVSTSIFDSKYKTSTDKWFNTRYNTQYISSITIGKDWTVDKSKRNTFGVNIKNAFAGGQWDTPIDRVASQLMQTEVRTEDKPFTERVKNYYKLDVGIKYKRNKNKYTSTLSLDIMNATNNKNIGGTSYDVQNDRITEWTMMPLVPIMSYKIEF